MVESKKKSTSKDKFIFEEEGNPLNSEYSSNSSFEEKNLEEDTEFIEFLRNNMKYPTAPDRIIEKAMAGYKKHYRYRILWRKIKTKLEEWKSFLPLNTQRVVLASIGVLFIIGAVAYYQYQPSKNTNPSNLVSQQTPVIKETPTTTPSPQSTAIPTPNITENNKQNNDNKLNANIKNKGNRQVLTAKNQQKINKGNNQVKQDKPIPQNNTIKNTDNNEPEEIAMLERERGQNATLATIKNIYVSDLIDTSLKNALVELLQTNGFKVIKNLANEPLEASLEYSFSEKNVIALSVKNRQVWKKSLDSSSPKQEAQAIVTSLLEAIEQAKKYLKNGKL